MFRLLHRLRRQYSPSHANPDQATEADVQACYRLLLNREPDATGLTYWNSMIRDHNISRETLTDGFLSGYEFRQRRAEQVRPRLVALPRFRMYVHRNDYFVGAVILREKQYEPHVTAALEQLLVPGATFLDIGANIGYFTLLAASLVGPTGRVLAFEPQAANRDLLQMSLQENGFGQVVTLYPYAVSDRAQTLFFTGGGADSNGRLVSEAEQAAWNVPLPQVETVALDALLPDLARLDVIKIDIEGAEPLAWRGMRGLIERHRPIILLEFSPQAIEATSGVSAEAFLADLRQHYHLASLHPLPADQKLPESASAIMALLARSGLTHLDLIAHPLSR